MSRLDADIDRLYQVPLTEFTAERNALARRAGADAGAIRGLQKPSIPAWAVNQLYWRDRKIYDELIERASDLRATHDAALRGKRTDLRGAGKDHEAAVDAALKATLGLLASSGHPVTDATRQAIATTLRALPGQDAPGRLSRQLQPRGFESLAALGSGGRVHPAPRPAPARAASGERGGDQTAATRKEETARLNAAREALTNASRRVRDSEHVARREQFEAARAVRQAEKAAQRQTEAEETLRQAEKELMEARRTAAAAAKARETAQQRAKKVDDDLTSARDAEAQARRKLDALS